MNKIIIITLLSFAYSLQPSQSQSQTSVIGSIHVISESEDYGHYTGLPMIFNNKLYIQCDGDKGKQLGELNANTIKVIKSLDSVTGGYLSKPIVYGNNLYFCSKSGFNLCLGKFDGSAISILPNFDNYYQYFPKSDPVVFDNKLWLQYNNRNNNTDKLVVFDGNNFKIADDNYLSVCDGPIVPYKNKIFFLERSRGSVYSYDGAKAEQFLEMSEVSRVHNNKLLGITGSRSKNIHAPLLDWVLWDGTTASKIPMLDDSASVSDVFNTVDFNNSLYFFINYPFKDYTMKYPAINTTCLNYTLYQPGSLDDDIAKYDGKKTVVLSNPGKGNYTSKFVICSNKLYMLLTKPAEREIPDAKDITQLVECDGNTLKLIPNPGSGSLDHQALISYHNKIYVQYDRNLAVYDGNKITVIPSTYKFDTDWYPIVFDNKLFFAINLKLGYYDDSN
jgi:hypothetical protein